MAKKGDSIGHKSLARVAVALVLVMAVGASLWFASPLPARALDITIAPPAPGTLGNVHTFTVTVDIEDFDVLPVWRIDLEIFNTGDATKTANLTGLPLGSSNWSDHTVTPSSAGSATVNASAESAWGYATAYSYGYGYRDPGGYGYHYFGTRGGYGYGYGSYNGTTNISYTVNWTSPSGWPAGSYQIKALVYGSATQKFSETSSSFSLSTSSGGGSGGPGGGGGGAAGITPVLGSMTSDGRFTDDVTAKSDDRIVEIFVPENTVVKNRLGSLISSISIKPMIEPPDLPDNHKGVGLIYRIGPDRATFDPPILLTMEYEASKIPDGLAEKNLVLAIRDTFRLQESQWEVLDSAVDPDNATVSANMSHFSAVVILAPNRPASFTMSNLTITPEEPGIGESLLLSLVVTNSGDLTGSHQLSLEIDGQVMETREVSLDGGDSEQVSFSITTDTAGVHAVAIGGLQGSFTVHEPEPPSPAAFAIRNLTIIPSEANAGEEVNIGVTITNTGSISGSYEAELKIGGVVEQVKEITLDQDTSLVVTFKTIRDKAGTYIVEVNGLIGAFVVPEEAPPVTPAPLPAPPSIPAPAPEPAPEPSGISWWLIGSLIAMASGTAIAGGIIIGRRIARRRRHWQSHLTEIEKQLDDLFKMQK
jgi:hypothetical protein